MKTFLIVIAVSALLAAVSCLSEKPITVELDGQKYNCERLHALASLYDSRALYVGVTSEMQQRYGLSEQEAESLWRDCWTALWDDVRPLPK